MTKTSVNNFLKKFGFEIHGLGYIQKLKNSGVSIDAFGKKRELFKSNAKIVFDVGANRGDTTQRYLELFPNAQIHAFEPFPGSYNIFQEKHLNKDRVTLNKYALSSKAGKAVMNVNSSVDTNSLLESTKIGATSDKSCETQGHLEVETNTLDNYCAQKDVMNIDILKIDVQGSELNVLKGGLKLLENNKIKTIYSEAYFEQQYVGQPLFHDIAAMLYQHNFVLQNIYDPYFSKTSNILWCDALFVNKNYFG